MNKLLVPVFCIVSLSGCAVTEYNYVPESQKISEPRIGQVNHITVGQPLVREGNISEIDGIKILNPVQIDLAYKIIPGVFKKGSSIQYVDLYFYE